MKNRIQSDALECFEELKNIFFKKAHKDIVKKVLDALELKFPSLLEGRERTDKGIEMNIQNNNLDIGSIVSNNLKTSFI